MTRITKFSVEGSPDQAERALAVVAVVVALFLTPPLDQSPTCRVREGLFFSRRGLMVMDYWEEDKVVELRCSCCFKKKSSDVFGVVVFSVDLPPPPQQKSVIEPPMTPCRLATCRRRNET